MTPIFVRVHHFTSLETVCHATALCATANDLHKLLESCRPTRRAQSNCPSKSSGYSQIKCSITSDADSRTRAELELAYLHAYGRPMVIDSPEIEPREVVRND